MLGPLCLRLLEQVTFFACTLAICSAGINIAINKAMAAINIGRAIKVNPVRKLQCCCRMSVWLPAKRGPSPCLLENLPLSRTGISVSNGVNPHFCLSIVILPFRIDGLADRQQFFNHITMSTLLDTVD
jgi:hypothetical protein